MNVERRHNLRVGEVVCDGAWHPHLVDGQVGVWCDHGARGEVNALSHQVATDATFLALETCSQRLQRPTRLLHSLA